MICYKDITWCPFGDCKSSKKCESFLSRKVEVAASKQELPIAIFTERPPCHEDDVINITIE